MKKSKKNKKNQAEQKKDYTKLIKDRKISSSIEFLGLLVMALGGYLYQENIIYLGFGVSMIGYIWKVRSLKCPSCGKALTKIYKRSDYCYHCDFKFKPDAVN